MLGGAYGRRAVVVAGRGNNGADGRVAGERLRSMGVRTEVLEATSAVAVPDCDLVIDAAYGTGFRGEYEAPPPPPGARVLSVDIPSGVNGDTGEACKGAVRADATVCFAALKPGLLLGDGPGLSGAVEIADIGLDVSRANVHVVEDSDVAAEVPRRSREDHKWTRAVMVVAGSPGMMGSAAMCSHSAMRAGSGMVHLWVPGARPEDLPAGEVVARALPASGWDSEVLEGTGRFRALVLGPGLGRSEETSRAVRRLVAEADLPVVVDADGLSVLGRAPEVARLVDHRSHPVVLTPHDGEFSRLGGSPPAADRVASVRELAASSGAVTLLKGSTTLVAEPAGRVLVSCAGSARLASAGTGDVLSGVIAAMLARGVNALEAAALGAHVHGRAASSGLPEGLVAPDLPELVAAWLSFLLAPDEWARQAGRRRLGGDRPGRQYRAWSRTTR